MRLLFPIFFGQLRVAYNNNSIMLAIDEMFRPRSDRLTLSLGYINISHGHTATV